MKIISEQNKTNPWFWLFIVIAAIMLFAMPTMSQRAGNSGDEDGFQIPQGTNVLNYYKSNHQDTTCFTFENLKYYGCSFDVALAWINEKLGVDDIHTTRHAANALLGWLAILFVGLIAYRIGGWRAGVFALILMFFSPRFLGHSFNNPKDIPFATGVIMSIYYIMMFFRQAPKIRWITLFTMCMLMLSIALAISTRIGGLIIVGYFGIWGLLWLIVKLRENKSLSQIKKNTLSEKLTAWHVTVTILLAFAVCLIGFFIGILLWPYAMQAPIKHSIESYHAMSQFAIAIRQIYEGTMMWSDGLPWYYTPKFIFTTIPICVIIGWVAYPIVELFNSKKSNEQSDKKETHRLAIVEKIMLYFCFLFPVAWIVYTNANVYGGWRHSLFAYPPMVASAALGFDAIVRIFDRENKTTILRVGKICATALTFVLLIGPIAHTIKNHPYEYVYFNKFVGGTKNVFAKYEMDYYYHSMREATEWVIDNADINSLPQGEKIVVGTWHINSTRYFLHHDTAQFKPRFVRWYSRGDYDWDYAVFPLTGISPEYLTSNKVFPPKDMVHSIDVDGVPIAVVLKRNDRNDYIGSQLKQQGNIDSALIHYHKALAYNPYNETALINIAEIYLQKGMPDSALWACNRFFEFEPTNDNANLFAAHAYLQKGEVDKALRTCESIKQHNYKYASAYQLILNIYLQQNNIIAAEKEILNMIDVDQLSNQVVQYYIAIKKASGLNEKMAYTSLYKAMIASYEKRGKKREAELYRSYLKQM